MTASLFAISELPSISALENYSRGNIIILAERAPNIWMSGRYVLEFVHMMHRLLLKVKCNPGNVPTVSC